MKDVKKTNDDDEYKEYTSQHQDGNESFINTNKEEDAFIKWLISINFKHPVIKYVIDFVTLC